jgi:hypothetical protein
VVGGAGDGGSVHACVGPTLSSHTDSGAPSSDPISCIYFKTTIVVTGLTDVSRPVGTVV